VKTSKSRIDNHEYITDVYIRAFHRLLDLHATAFYLPIKPIATRAEWPSAKDLTVRSSLNCIPHSDFSRDYQTSDWGRDPASAWCRYCMISTVSQEHPGAISDGPSNNHLTHLLKEFFDFFHRSPGNFAYTKVDIGQRDKTSSGIDEACLWPKVGRIV
jgi:hypothetical protein